MSIGRERAGAAVAAGVLALGPIVFATTAAAHDSPARVQATATATEPTATLATNTPEEALASFVAARALPFAGPCEQTRSPRDVGRVCERFIEERASDGMRAYLIGRTFSEFTTWVFVAVRDGKWMAVSTCHSMTVLSLSPSPGRRRNASRGAGPAQ